MVRAHGNYSHAHLKAIGPESKNKAMGACTSLGFNGVRGSGGRSFFVELNPMKRNMQLIQVILAHIESGTIETFLENCEEEAQWAEGQSLDEHLLESQKKEETAQIVLEHLWLCEDAGCAGRHRFYPISVKIPGKSWNSSGDGTNHNRDLRNVTHRWTTST